MTPVTQWVYTQREPFRPHLEQLRLLAEPLEKSALVSLRAALEDSCAFLWQQLALHLDVVEQVLYPLLEHALEGPDALVSLRCAHREIRHLIDQLLALCPALSREPVYLEPELQALVATLATRVTDYFSEEALYLARLDSWLTPAAAHGLAVALEMVTNEANTRSRPQTNIAAMECYKPFAPV